jgi:hypothetical protein
MNEDTKVRKQRSPNFPSLALEKCIEFAKTFYEKYRRTPIAYEVAINWLGYSPMSSGGLQLVAALSAYGLIEVTGSGKEKRLKLSELAYRIIEDRRPSSSERDKALHQAALTPAMFLKIYDENRDSLPPEDALAHDLKFKYGFNPNSVHTFIKVITHTFNFAKIYESDVIHDENRGFQEAAPISGGDMQVQISGRAPIAARMPVPSMMESEREIAKYPVGRDVSIRLIASGPITQKSIEKLIKMLQINVEDFPVNEEGLGPIEIKEH